MPSSVAADLPRGQGSQFVIRDTTIDTRKYTTHHTKRKKKKRKEFFFKGNTTDDAIKYSTRNTKSTIFIKFIGETTVDTLKYMQRTIQKAQRLSFELNAGRFTVKNK